VGARYFVRSLQLAHFRSHAALELALDARPVCLIGPNGAGKTNVLEALSVLSPGRSLRGAALGDLAQGGEEAARGRARGWSVFTELETGAALHRLGVAAEHTPEGGLKRVVRLDGRSPSAAELAGAVRLAWITPAMDRLFAGSPGDRRRFLDRLTLANAPEHGAHAAAYERALRERTRLLAEERHDAAWLSGLEQQMAERGAAIAAARADTAARLAAAIAAEQGAAFPKAAVALEGALEQAAAGGAGLEALAAQFRQALAVGRRRDAAAGRALSGPHRSDLMVHHAEKGAPAAQCSTGEQKALLLGLVLAHVRALAANPAAGPALLLLDEAGAHLDPPRREALAAEAMALPGQVWLTGTDDALFEGFGDGAQRVRL
jgi:DNA replication and repair protein RecF